MRIFQCTTIKKQSPSYIYFWSQISYSSFLGLLDWISHGAVKEGNLILPYTREALERFSVGKRALEIIGCPHIRATESIVLSHEDTLSLLFNLGIPR